MKGKNLREGNGDGEGKEMKEKKWREGNGRK